MNNLNHHNPQSQSPTFSYGKESHRDGDSCFSKQNFNYMNMSNENSNSIHVTMNYKTPMTSLTNMSMNPAGNNNADHSFHLNNINSFPLNPSQKQHQTNTPTLIHNQLQLQHSNQYVPLQGQLHAQAQAQGHQQQNRHQPNTPKLIHNELQTQRSNQHALQQAQLHAQTQTQAQAQGHQTIITHDNPDVIGMPLAHPFVLLPQPLMATMSGVPSIPVNTNPGMSQMQMSAKTVLSMPLPMQPMQPIPIPTMVPAIPIQQPNPFVQQQQQVIHQQVIHQQISTPFPQCFPSNAQQVAPFFNAPQTQIADAAMQTPQQHLQATSFIPNKTPMIPIIPTPSPTTATTTVPLTVQDRPHEPPVFNGVNLSYPNVHRIRHLGNLTNNQENEPPLYAIPDFLTPAECDFLISSAQSEFTIAPVVGPGVGTISSSRTSSTCYLAREDLPILMKKVCCLTNTPVEHCELPQVGRYLPTQQYLQHYDAFDLSNQDGIRFAANGGQRVVTVLIYLNAPQSGGHTRFPALLVREHENYNVNTERPENSTSNNVTNIVPLEIKPKKGMAIVFFPSTVDGLLDQRALHAALPAEDTKYVSQIWIRQGNYEGQPSVRLSQIMDDSVNNGNMHMDVHTENIDNRGKNNSNNDDEVMAMSN